MMPTDAMSWLMWVMVAGFLALLWASALLLARTVLPGRPRRARDENEAIGELSLRLARGEITADEFEQQRQLVLDAFRPWPPPSRRTAPVKSISRRTVFTGSLGAAALTLAACGNRTAPLSGGTRQE